MASQSVSSRPSTDSLFEGWVRTSQYITVRDGTRLAADLFRPANKGRPVSEPLPVLWAHHRYRRAYVTEGGMRTVLDRMPWLRTVLSHGYVIAAVDVRGGGASQGIGRGPFGSEESWDAYDVTEWF